MADEIVVEHEPKPPVRTHSGWAKLGFFISALAFIIFICAFSIGYFQLAKKDQALSAIISQTNMQMIAQEKELATLKNTTETLREDAQKIQTLSAQQDQLVNEWHVAQKGSLTKWHVAEVAYLIKLANDHAQFNHDFTLSTLLLKRATDILNAIEDPALLEIKKSLANDLATLEAIPQIDITNLYLRLNALNQQIDALPLPENPLKPQAGEMKPLPAATDQSWWQRGLAHTAHLLKQIVVVRNIGMETPPLILPEQKNFLMQNLHAQMENVMWAVLHRDQPIYSTSLANVMTWIKKYFVAEASETQKMLENLLALQNTDLTLPTVNFSNTLLLLNNYLNAVATPPTTAA